MSATNGQFGSPELTEPVLYASVELEDLGHTNAFPALLEKHMIGRQDTLRIDAVTIPHLVASSELVEAHHFPAEFNVKNFRAELIRRPAISDDRDEENRQPIWLFTAAYDVNDRSYRMFSSGKEVTIGFQDDYGANMNYTFAAGTATSFMGALATGVLQSQGVDTPFRVPRVAVDSPTILEQLFRDMGHLDGVYCSSLDSLIPLPEDDRAIHMRLAKMETPGNSSLVISHRMISLIGSSLLSDVISHQQEDSEFQRENPWTVRYAQRQPSGVLPEDLRIATELGDSDAEALSRRKTFFPEDGNLHYASVNTSIMAMLRPLLTEFAHLDDDPIIIEDEGYLEGFDLPDLFPEDADTDNLDDDSGKKY